MAGSIDQNLFRTPRATVNASVLLAAVHARHVVDEVFRVTKSAAHKQRRILHKLRLKHGTGVAGFRLQNGCL